MQLTEHFKLSEFERSGTASKYGIDNHVPSELITNIKHLCEQILEPLRQHFNVPIVISSGYRCPKLNAHPEVRGVSNSQHKTGEAADIRIPTIKAPNGSMIQDMATARKWITYILDLRFDQLILEHDKSGHYWIHVSICRDDKKNRQTYLPNLLKK